MDPRKKDNEWGNNGCAKIVGIAGSLLLLGVVAVCSLGAIGLS